MVREVVDDVSSSGAKGRSIQRARQIEVLCTLSALAHKKEEASVLADVSGSRESSCRSGL